MSVSVTLPQMGESVTEGTIIRWLKKEGESVTEDEPLVEVSTDKIDTELPAPASGVLAKIIVGPDQTVDVGTELGVIEAGNGAAAATPKDETKSEPKDEKPKDEKPKDEKPKDEKPKDEKPKDEPAEPAPEPRAQPAAAAKPSGTPSGGARSDDTPARATSPLVRKLARELDMDLDQVPGSGSGGRITKDDVIAAARAHRTSGARKPARAAPTPSRYEVPGEPQSDVAFDRVRTAIAEHMVRSRATAAHVTNIVEVDMTDIATLRERAKDAFRRAEGVGLTYMPFIASAVVQALRTYPEFNAHVLEDGTTARLFRTINLGIAVGRDEGLIVPVVHDAETLNLTGLARAIADVGERARQKGKLTPNDVAGGTFTITNYGSIGGIMDTPIINQPQVAILGVGAVVKRPAVVSADGVDAVAIRHQMFLSLSYDHRWIDGHQAARFNSRVKDLLETTDFSGQLGL